MMDEGDGYVGKLTQQAFEIGVLRHENAKLRELLLDVVLLAPNRGADIMRVEWSASDGSWLSIEDRMRELGVDA